MEQKWMTALDKGEIVDSVFLDLTFDFTFLSIN